MRHNDTILLILKVLSLLNKFMLCYKISISCLQNKFMLNTLATSYLLVQLGLLIIEIKCGRIRWKMVGLPGSFAEISFYHEHVPRY